MEDKTAEIPSLKKFTTQNKKSSDRGRRSSGVNSRSTSKGSQSSERSTADRRPQSTNRGTQKSGDRTQGRKPSAPAPRTYARQRQEVSEAIARTQVVNTKGAYPESKPSDRYGSKSSSQPLHKQRNRTHSGRSTASHTSRSSSNRPAPPGAGGSSSGGNPPSQGRRPSGKKQKRPLSPRARRFRTIVINTGLCIAVLIVGVILSLTVWFKTEDIVVNGNGDIPKNEIIAASGLTTGDNIFTAPKARAEEKIEKAFPYVQQAEIKAVFPNSISIDITMATPSCIIEGLGGYYIVSGEGKVLEVSSTTDEIQAPVIEGVNVGGKVAGDFVEYGSTVVGDALKEMFNAFEELGCTKVTAINVTAQDDAVEIKYVHDNRIVVYLGIPEHITYKIQTAYTIIKEKIDTGGTMIAGDLDVSMCHDSMKSYFNQYTLLSPNSAFATEPETSVPQETESPTQVYYY